jgi:hypothetical protein
MPRLNISELRALFDDVMLWAEKVEEVQSLADKETGEARSAYAIVHKDYLWKIQRKVGQLWYCVSVSDDMNPFEDTTRPASE